MNTHAKKPRPPLAPGMLCTDIRDGSTVRVNFGPVDSDLGPWVATDRLTPDGEWFACGSSLAEYFEPLDEALPGDDDAPPLSLTIPKRSQLLTEARKRAESSDKPKQADWGDALIHDALYKDQGPIGILYSALADLDDEISDIKNIAAGCKSSVRELRARRREIVAAIQKLAEA